MMFPLQENRPTIAVNTKYPFNTVISSKRFLMGKFSLLPVVFLLLPFASHGQDEILMRINGKPITNLNSKESTIRTIRRRMPQTRRKFEIILLCLSILS